jgi:hypothetical protein
MVHPDPQEYWRVPLEGTSGTHEQHASGPLRGVRAGELRWEDLLDELKAGPGGSRLRRPSSRRQDSAET